MGSIYCQILSTVKSRKYFLVKPDLIIILIDCLSKVVSSLLVLHAYLFPLRYRSAVS